MTKVVFTYCFKKDGMMAVVHLYGIIHSGLVFWAGMDCIDDTIFGNMGVGREVICFSYTFAYGINHQDI